MRWDNIDDSKGIDYTNIPPLEAGVEFVEFIISMKLANVISARQACVLSFFASKAGAVGPCSDLAMPPNKQSGKYHKRFDKVVGTKPSDANHYSLPLAIRLRHEGVRSWSEIPVTS